LFDLLKDGGPMNIARIISLGAALFVLAAPSALAQLQQNVPAELISYPDTILYNGKVLTADEKFTVAEAVAIRDDEILAVGTTQRILALAGPQTQKFDLQGRSAIPGLIDTHLHQAWVTEEPPPPGTKRVRPRFDTVENALADLKAIAAQAKPGEVIALTGPSNKVVTVDLNAKLLDQVSPNNPLYIEASNDQVVANTALIKMLLESAPNVPGVLKDGQGNPTGQMRGAASGEAVWVMKPWPDTDKLFEPQKASLARLNQVGLTTIMGRASPLSTTVLRDLDAAGQLTARVRIFHEFLRQNAEPERFLKRVGNLTGVGNDTFKIVGTTVQVVDGGGVESHLTAKPKMTIPAGSPYTAFGQNKWAETGDLDTSDRRNIILANRYGWTIGGLHSSGDMSNTLILEAFEEAHKERPLNGRHFGIDHGEQWLPEHYPKLKAMGVIPSLYSKVMYNNERRIEVFGRDNVFKQQPVKSLIASGIRPAAEADASGPSASPFFNMKNWITRVDDKGWQLDPAEKVSREEALYMYTLWAAAYSGEEKRLGSIEPGKLADIVVLNGDYMTWPVNDLHNLRVLMTLMGGKVVYQAPGTNLKQTD
jgi:predicted amidohydrolase YtcJ